MMKVHISLNVSDLAKSVEFYEKMFGKKAVKHFPAGTTEHRQSGYAKFDLSEPALNLALNEGNPKGGSRLSHLGIQLQSTDDVKSFQERWESEGLITVEETGVACCFANQDKAWVKDPDGNEWEAFTVLGDVVESEANSQCCDDTAKFEGVQISGIQCG